jgi:hypothetical protein
VAAHPTNEVHPMTEADRESHPAQGENKKKRPHQLISE